MENSNCFSLSCILFDWGDTLMRDCKDNAGAMKDWEHVEAVPGAAEILETLNQGFRLCLASNADVSNEWDIHAALQRVGIAQWLEKIYCFKNIGFKKPSHYYYEAILADLGLAPGKVLMVGDNYEADVLGAAACQIRAVWFNEKDTINYSSDFIRTIHRLSNLPEVIKTW